MSQLDPRSVVRIAIALAARKHKPRNQSTASYLLDLQSHFPVATEHNGNQEWRTYALELEKQLAMLKAQRDADQELLSELPAEVALSSDAPPPKKKSKKNATKDRRDPEWSWDQCCAVWSRFLSSQYPSSPSLVAVHASLSGALASPNTDLLSYASRLSDAILRALDAINLFLFSPANPSPDVHAQSTSSIPSQLELAHIDSSRIALASPLVMYVLRTALYVLVCTAQDSTKSKRRQRQHTTPVSTDTHAHVDKTLDHVLELLLLPLLRSLAPLCSARLAPLVSAPLQKDKASRAVEKRRDMRIGTVSIDPSKKTDVRTDVFALIGTSLEMLDALPPLSPPSGPGADGARPSPGNIPNSIRDRLGLEAVRELEALYVVSHASHPPTPAPSGSLQLSSPPPLAKPSERPQSTPNLTPLSTQPECQLPKRAVTESRATRLERLAGTRVERVRVLATRDAGWFLASTLSLCVTSRIEHSGGLLREALLDRIGKLVRSAHVTLDRSISDNMTDQQSGHPSSSALDGRPIVKRTPVDSKMVIDPVCQNMLLAICERAMSHLISC